jgi:hypothetical protein
MSTTPTNSADIWAAEAAIGEETSDVTYDDASDAEPEQLLDIEIDPNAETQPEPKPEAEDPEFELALNGDEPAKVKLSELSEGYKQWTALKDQVGTVVARVESQALHRQAETLQAYSHGVTQRLQQIDAYMATLPQPQPPDMEMLNRSNPAKYDPERYMLEKARYDQIVGFQSQQMQQRQQLAQQQQQAIQQQEALRAQAELRTLSQLWPEWADPAKAAAEADTMVRELGKHYKLDLETLESVSDHRFFLLAKDALQYRALQKGADVQKAVAVKREAPRATRSTQTPPRAGDGRFVQGAMKALTTGPYSADKGRAAFEALIKQGKL